MDVSEFNESQRALTILKKDINNNMVNHAYLLYGDNVESLSQIAKDMAKMLVCKNGGSDSCNVCKNIQNNIFSDVLMFPRVANIFKTEEANYVVNESFVTPLENDYKIFIINNFENATVSAQNKLLKTLEGPPKNVVFILTAANLFGVLETIRSRSKKIFILQDNFESVNDELKNLAFGLFNNMKRSNEVLKYSQMALNVGDQINALIEIIQKILLYAIKVNLGVSLNLTDTDILNINKIAKDFTPQCLQKLFNYSVDLEKQLKMNVNKNASMENFLIKILEVRFECQK